MIRLSLPTTITTSVARVASSLAEVLLTLYGWALRLAPQNLFCVVLFTKPADMLTFMLDAEVARMLWAVRHRRLAETRSFAKSVHLLPPCCTGGR
jgi:hypothetical protein